MRLWKLLLAAFVVILALSVLPSQSEAKTFTVDNHYGRKVSLTLVVPTQSGWRVIGWYTIEPYSRKTFNIPQAGGNAFAYYAYSGNVRWAGNQNSPRIAVVSQRMNHGVRQQPYGSNLRAVYVRTSQGNYLKLTGPPQQRQQQRMNSFW